MRAAARAWRDVSTRASGATGGRRMEGVGSGGLSFAVLQRQSPAVCCIGKVHGSAWEDSHYGGSVGGLPISGSSAAEIDVGPAPQLIGCQACHLLSGVSAVCLSGVSGVCLSGVASVSLSGVSSVCLSGVASVSHLGIPCGVGQRRQLCGLVCLSCRYTVIIRALLSFFWPNVSN